MRWVSDVSTNLNAVVIESVVADGQRAILRAEVSQKIRLTAACERIQSDQNARLGMGVSGGKNLNVIRAGSDD